MISVRLAIFFPFPFSRLEKEKEDDFLMVLAGDCRGRLVILPWHDLFQGIFDIRDSNVVMVLLLTQALSNQGRLLVDVTYTNMQDVLSPTGYLNIIELQLLRSLSVSSNNIPPSVGAFCAPSSGPSSTASSPSSLEPSSPS